MPKTDPEPDMSRKAAGDGLRLRFDHRLIQGLSVRYSYSQGDEEPGIIGSRAEKNGFLSRADFLRLCRWKTPRSQKKCAENTPELAQEPTRVAFTCTEEQMRIGVLMLLRGVDLPTASAILHFCHTEPYPLLDRRALWSVGAEKPTRNKPKFWWSYTVFCRNLAERSGVSMRVLDRALWQYSQENES